MNEICCGYCSAYIPDNSPMYVAKEPYRAPRNAHLTCGERAKQDSRGRTQLTTKVNRGGIVSDISLTGSE